MKGRSAGERAVAASAEKPPTRGLGNYLSHKGAFAKRQGDQEASQKSYARAEARLQKLPE